MTDRFRFWYANLAVIDRSFEHKTRKFAVCAVFFISAGKSVFSNMTDDGWLWNRCKVKFFYKDVCDFRWLIGWTQIELSQNVTPFPKSTVCDNSNPGLRSEACMNSTIWEPHFALSQNTEFIQKHPTSVFCKISARRSKYCLEFSIIWGRLKISRWSFHLCKIFHAYLTNSLGFSEV